MTPAHGSLQVSAPFDAAPLEWLSAVESALRARNGTRQSGPDELTIRCLEPEAHKHGDRNPSAGWNTRKGCGQCHVCRAKWSAQQAAELLGVQLPRLSASQKQAPSPPAPGGKLWKFEIRDASGKLQAVHCRRDKPDGSKGPYHWRGPNGEPTLGGRKVATLPLYGAHLVGGFDRARPVFVVEGEKKCDAATEIGLQVVATVTGASGYPSAESLSVLDDFENVRLWPDNDTPGADHMARVGKLVPRARVLAPTGRSGSGDDCEDLIRELRRDGLNANEIREQVENLKGEEAPGSSLRTAAETLDDASTVSDLAWPHLAHEAYHGPLGELVELIDPDTEADPVAVLVQALVAFGSIVGRNPHFRVEGDKHPGNLFIALVGDSSKSRKGSSWSRVREPLVAVDPAWGERVVSGLSSGEGLIWPVRDQIVKIDKDGEEVVTDSGVADKRLLIVEPELARLFQVLCRSGNTLSAQLRDAWDRGRLQSLTKNSPAAATGAHIALIGHITRQELLRHLGETEAGNGFGNRFLWCLVKRSKCLPWGGQLDGSRFRPVIEKIEAAVAHAGTLGQIQPDAAARDLWESVYEPLSSGKPGLLGSMIARAEAQTLRLALLYALADSRGEIGFEHLKAALAVWDYAEASARYIFGDALGDPVADEILQALRRSRRGMTRNQIREIFGRHKRSNEIGRALKMLADQQLATCTKLETGGRPAERWTLFAHRALSAQGGDR